MLMYEKSFWRENGLPGQIISVYERVGVVMDSIPGHQQWAALVDFIYDSDTGKDLIELTTSKQQSAII